MCEKADHLQKVFESIHRERMADMPMVNPALQVATIGFDKNEYGCVGILLTPWCMNLLLLPEGDEWAAAQPGSKQMHGLPSGDYEFVVADEVGLGRYLSCSLFSPMFEFADQETALATAEASLLAVMSEKPSDETQDNIGQGTVMRHNPERPDLEERTQVPMSRRAFLRGAFLK